MNPFEWIAEQRIREALEKGLLDDNPYKGQPLPADEFAHLPPEVRVGARMLRGAGYLPEELQLQRRLTRIEELLDACDIDREGAGREALLHERRDKSLRLELLLERRGCSALTRAWLRGARRGESA